MAHELQTVEYADAPVRGELSWGGKCLQGSCHRPNGQRQCGSSFGNYIGPKLEQAGVRGIRALVDGIFAADIRLGDGGNGRTIPYQ